MIKNAPEHPKHLLRLSKSSVLQIVIITVALLILIPQFTQFRSSWNYVTGADIRWLAVALVGMAATIICATLVYIALVPHKLPLRRTLLIQMATYFTNRLLPSGLGGIGFNALYLVKQAKLSRTDAAVYATANNIVGFIAFSICTTGSVIIGSSRFSFPHISLLPTAYILIALGIIVAFLAVFQKRLLAKLYHFIGHLFGVILTIIRHPRKLILAIVCSIGITVSYVSVLWAASLSVGISLSVVDLFIAFIAGNAALTISPTPGGIGAVEASLTAVLVGISVSPSVALAGVLLFRLISYWLPIIPGYIAFRYASQKNYV